MALTFDYKVRDRTGNLVQGQLEGDSLALVVGKLREMGYMPVAVTPKSAVSVRKEITIPGFSNRVKLGETAVATRQLATMVDSGLSVVRALGLLATRPRTRNWPGSWVRCGRRSSGARRLSAACAKFPKIFNTLCSSPWSRPVRRAGTWTRSCSTCPPPWRSRPCSTARSSRP